MITVKIGKLPGVSKEVNLEDGAKVSDAIRVAEISDVSGFEIRVNANVASTSTVLTDGAIVTITKMSKGN